MSILLIVGNSSTSRVISVNGNVGFFSRVTSFSMYVVNDKNAAELISGLSPMVYSNKTVAI